MDSVTHVPLLVPKGEPHSCRNFREEIAHAVTKATEFLKEHPNGLPDNALEAWAAEMDGAALKAYRNNVRYVCAVTGAYYSAISSGITGSATRRYIGALGQSRLIMALILLRNSDREVLFQFKEINQSVRGARAVARLASALNAAGGQCHLPTAYEDADLKIDLLCVYQGKLACIQVKFGDRPESHIAEGQSTEEREFIWGVERFNEMNEEHAVPLWVSTITFSNVSPQTMVNDRAVAFAKQVLALLQPTPPQ